MFLSVGAFNLNEILGFFQLESGGLRVNLGFWCCCSLCKLGQLKGGSLVLIGDVGSARVWKKLNLGVV